MKKIIAFLLAMAMLLSLAACGGEEPSIKDNAATLTADTTEAPTEASDEPVTEVSAEESTEAPTEVAASFGGPNSYQLEEWNSHTMITVNFTLPESMWVVDPQAYTLYLYNVESLDVAHSAAPRIQFEAKESMENVDSYMKDMTELVELDTRQIGGIEMKGRPYKLWGMVWTEYYGELPDGIWMTVRISKTSVDAGSEGSDILDSVTFE